MVHKLDSIGHLDPSAHLHEDTLNVCTVDNTDRASGTSSRDNTLGLEERTGERRANGISLDEGLAKSQEVNVDMYDIL